MCHLIQTIVDHRAAPPPPTAAPATAAATTNTAAATAPGCHAHVNGHHNTVTQHTDVHYHQTFHLNFFLNDLCGGAMNLSAFLDDIPFDDHHLRTLARKNFIDGLSDTIIQKLQEVGMTERPIHCTNLHDNTMYIRENDTWQRDTKQNDCGRQMVDVCVSNGAAALHEYAQRHPGCQLQQSPHNAEYEAMYSPANGIQQGSSMSMDKTYKCVLNRVCKATYVDQTAPELWSTRLSSQRVPRVPTVQGNPRDLLRDAYPAAKRRRASRASPVAGDR